MGYETRLLFVGTTSLDGWCKIIAELEMGKIASDEVGKLINKLMKDVKEKYSKETYHLLNKLETATNKERYNLERKIRNQLPHFYTISSEEPIYDDKYGDLLLITDLKTLKDAIASDQEKMIKEDEKGYRRFDVALAIIDKLMNKDNWSENIKVILWGH